MAIFRSSVKETLETASKPCAMMHLFRHELILVNSLGTHNSMLS